MGEQTIPPPLPTRTRTMTDQPSEPDLSDRWQGGHHCGPAEDRRKPGRTLASQHRRAGTIACGKAKAEATWAEAQRKARRALPNWEPAKKVVYKCGETADRETPSRKTLRVA